MNIGLNAQNGGSGRWMSGLSQPRNEGQSQSRGEKIVERLDKDGDGKLALNELAESKIGQRLTLQRMARMDANGDGMLEASEFNRTGGAEGAEGKVAAAAAPAAEPATRAAPEMMEAVFTSNMADYLTEKVSTVSVEERAESLAKEIIKRLDADGSGRLNTEEIAGTRLAEKIGEGFYNLDADKSGGLDLDELFGFLRDQIMTLAEERGLIPAEGDDAVEGLAEASLGEAADAIEAVGVVEETSDAAVQLVEEAVEAAQAEAAEAAAEAAAAEAAEEAGSDFEMTAEDLVKTAFENALKMIQEGQENRSTFDVVSALYGNIQSIFDAA